MKRFHFLLFLLPAAAFVLGSCQKKYNEYFSDPNRAVQASPALVLNGVLNNMAPGAWNSEMRWNQFWNYNYNYYGNQEYNWTAASLSYTTLKNVLKMEEEAKRSGAGDLNPYAALGKFFRAYFFYQMTMRLGDLPLKEALQGLENQQPKYDTQKEIFVQILKWLDEANSDLAQLIAAADATLNGDIYHENNLKKWQKTVNAFQLRVLIALSQKNADGELNIKNRFSEILANNARYPLPEGMGDNLQYVYVPPFNKYPINPDNYGFNATRVNMAATHLNTLASLHDPRTFVVAEPAPKKLAAGLQPNDYNAYVGASSAEDLADMSTKALNGEYSWIGRKRYYFTYNAEPTIIIGYPEICFNIAEAINRGWVAGDAEEWYKKGIQSSIAFYGITNGANSWAYQKPGGSLGEFINYTFDFDWNAYYSQPAVKYAGNNAAGLSQIITQKYLAFFQNSGFEAYFNYRRTGLPSFEKGGPGTGNSGLIPKRFQYPNSELVNNEANLKEALQRQFGGTDDINADMWLLK